MEAATRRTPAIEVLDWSKSADRASYRRLTRQQVVRENERVTPPMLVAAGIVGCLFTWYLLEGGREGAVQAILLPVVLSALVGGQLALIFEDPRFCAGCAVFLAAIAATAGCCATAPVAHPESAASWRGTACAWGLQRVG